MMEFVSVKPVIALHKGASQTAPPERLLKVLDSAAICYTLDSFPFRLEANSVGSQGWMKSLERITHQDSVKLMIIV